MAVKIRLCHIRLAKRRAFIFLCHDLLAVRVVQHDVFTHRIAGVTDRKMRTCLFRDQNRKFGFNIKFSSHLVCHGIRSDRKFAHRKGFAVIQYIFFDIFFILLFCLIIRAVVGINHAVFKYHLQILIAELVQVNFSHMQHAIGSGKFW